MGHRKKHAPKRGSLAFLPKKRASKPVGRIRHWPETGEGPKLLGFMGYKAGVTHVFMIEDKHGSPNFGQEIMRAATVLDAPPIFICGVRAYRKTPYGLQTFTEAWMRDPPEDLERVFTLSEDFNQEEKLGEIKESLDKIAEFRILAITQPRLTGVAKKKPDLMEVKIGGGTLNEQSEYVEGLLGKTVSAVEVFKEGQYVDAVAVSKGKGWQGPVKRWGIKILSRKSRKHKRAVAALGPWKPPRMLYTVPRAGQMGYHQRTEFNKRILKIGNDGKEVTPHGGFLRYGLIRGPYMLIDGSLPGSVKRLIRLRYPVRSSNMIPKDSPNIVHVSLESPQSR